MNRKARLFYKFIENAEKNRLEWHVASDKKEVEAGQAMSKAISLDSERLVEWKEEMMEQVEFFEMKEVM